MPLQKKPDTFTDRLAPAMPFQACRTRKRCSPMPAARAQDEDRVKDEEKNDRRRLQAEP